MIRRAALRWLAAAALLAGSPTSGVAANAPVEAPTEASPPPIGHAEIVLDLPPGGAFPDEMLKLHVRSSTGATITLEALRPPALVDLDWKQLGPDAWSYVMENGLQVHTFERTMAVYPQRPGRITIAPFVHHLTIIGTDGIRREHDLRTRPLTFDVRPLPENAGAWWLPAAHLRITDTWDKRPDRLSLGETARRTVEIEAAGIGVERLPPAPKMRAPGIISFAIPTQRSSTVSNDGPVARAVYQWDVRPVSADAAVLPAVEIPWFDTIARRNRVAVIPERRISLAAADLRDEATGQVVGPPPFSLAAFLVSAAAASAWCVAAAWLVGKTGSGNALKLRPLRRAARRNDAKAFRSALSPFAGILAGTRDPGLRDGLIVLERHLFGRDQVPAPDLAGLYAGVARAVRAAARRSSPRAAASRLLPLDGGSGPPTSWHKR